jgi:hypothetical protein
VIPCQCIGQWLKEAPGADQAHKIVRYDRDLLVSYCGRAFPVTLATRHVLGVRVCMECARLAERRYHDRIQALMHHFTGRTNVARRQHS